MRAKCIWKMYQKPYTTLDHYDRQSRPTVEQLIRALEESVEAVWALPKPRSGTDPILEPHYKIVSVVYKLVARGDLEPQEAADILQRQPFAIKKGARVEINDTEEWEPFVIETLSHLKDKDKSNWQHRIIMRHARLLFDDKAENPEVLQALSAFQVLQKTMFTKTMVMNVWKCDAERPGRHHVYTEQYVRFMVKLLVTLKDRTNFEALLRRIRKKGGDFYHFNDLWQTCCIAYLRMIRSHYKIQPIIDDVYKNVSQEEFEIIAERITEWSTDANTSDHSAFEALKEAVELKKLNSALMKAGAVDDLIYDSYTAFYFEVGKTLPGPPLEELIKERTEANKIKKGELEKEKKPANPFTALLNPQSVENSGTDAAGPAAAAHEASVRPRRAGVRRPDLLRKAEQAVMRAIDGPVKPTREKSRASVSSSKSRNNSRTPTGEVVGSRGEDGDVEMKDDDAHEGHESSPPRSFHDSADDESDLSDVPDDILDDEEAALLFPGLIRRNTQEAEEEDEEDEEEGDGDADDEEEEHEEQEEGEEEVEAMDHDGHDGEEHDHSHDHGAEEDEEEEEEEEEEDADEAGLDPGPAADHSMQNEEDEDEEMGEGHADQAAEEDLEEEEEEGDEEDEDEELETESETGDTIEAVIVGGPTAQH